MNFNLPAGVATTVISLFWLATALVHIVFAIGVFKDAEKLVANNRETQFVPSFVWSMATLVGGVFVAGIYWAMHHSSLVAVRPAEPKE